MNKTIKRRTETKIETHEITIIRANVTREHLYCRSCNTSVAVFLPEQVTGVIFRSPDDVRKLIAAGMLHFVDDGSGRGLICGRSMEPKSEGNE
ncbi:MAG: hypothetical protein ABIU09_09380 [Pyrinomonadaceae bacterium]